MYIFALPASTWQDLYPYLAPISSMIESTTCVSVLSLHACCWHASLLSVLLLPRISRFVSSSSSHYHCCSCMLMVLLGCGQPWSCLPHLLCMRKHYSLVLVFPLPHSLPLMSANALCIITVPLRFTHNQM